MTDDSDQPLDIGTVAAGLTKCVAIWGPPQAVRFGGKRMDEVARVYHEACRVLTRKEFITGTDNVTRTWNRSDFPPPAAFISREIMEELT